MKKVNKIVAAVVLAFGMASCSPVIINPVMVTDNPVGSKVGEASYRLNFFGMPSKKDANRGIAEACKNGGITKVGTVAFKYDVQAKSYVTIVTGE